MYLTRGSLTARIPPCTIDFGDQVCRISNPAATPYILEEIDQIAELPYKLLTSLILSHAGLVEIHFSTVPLSCQGLTI